MRLGCFSPLACEEDWYIELRFYVAGLTAILQHSADEVLDHGQVIDHIHGTLDAFIYCNLDILYPEYYCPYGFC